MHANFYISDKERAALPADIFAGPNRSFPIRNQQDVHDAARLIGHADNPEEVKRNIIRLAKRKGFKLPASWQVGMSEDDASDAPVRTAHFDLGSDATASGDYILRRGKVGEAGNFPDKQIAFTADELDAAAASFAPVEMDSEHGESLLDGALGSLRRVWRHGKELWGEVAIPKELDALFTSKQIRRSVSLTWDRATKRITGCAWAKYPRVGDAAVFSDEPEAGGSRPQTAPARGKETHPMPINWGEFKALFKKAGIEVDEAAPDTGAVIVSAASVASAAEFKAVAERLTAELAALKAQMAGGVQFSDAKIQEESLNFARALFTANKALPAQLPAIAKGYVAALTADRTAAQFSADGKMATPTLDTFKACFTDAPAHKLTEESIADVAEKHEDAIFALGARPEAEAVKMKRDKELADRLNPVTVYGKRAAIGTGKAV